ncbi:MAG: ATP-grasp domain-containing protein [Candidatus Omnitrophica bacterium]|nr:ATP-grasp domain-containing protein [Candidatus Omnitrophota bacterium]
MENIIHINIKNNSLFSKLNSEEIARFSDLGEKLNASEVRFLLVKKSNAFLEKWSQKYKITLISPDYNIGGKIENKIYFDTFLSANRLPKPVSKVISSNDDRMPFPMTILQIPVSSGGEGTFLIKTQKIFSELSRKFEKPLLARKYQKGMPLGVSLFIDKEKIYFTALERQCFHAGKNNSVGDFIGIQWLPYTFFDYKVYKKIEKFLLQIGRKLSLEGLQGLINIDFILDKTGSIYCLECNPRLTFATNQILSQKELRNGVDYIDLYVKNLKTREGISSLLPKSTFLGCQMLISFPPQTKFPHAIKTFIQSGFFIFENNLLKEVELENRMDFLKLKNGIFYYNEIDKGEVYQSSIQIGTVIANFPLYSLKTGKLNKAGKEVYNYFINQTL